MRHVEVVPGDPTERVAIPRARRVDNFLGQHGRWIVAGPAAGQSFTLEIKPGRHQLRAHNTLFWRTVIFHVEAGEHLEFLLINKGGPITFGIAALLGSAPVFLKIERRSVV